MRRTTYLRREGFALAVAIGAIVVIGLLITGVFFASTQQFRIGGNALRQAHAQTAAEYGLNALFDPNQSQADAHWSSAWNTTSSADGLKTTVAFQDSANGAVDTVRVMKLNSTSFLVTSEANAGTTNGPTARRRLGALVTLAVPDVHMRGAVTIKGSVKYGGSASISGKDSSLDGRDCPPVGATLPGLAIPNLSNIRCSGCSGAATGNPPVYADSMAAKDTMYTQFGGMNWDALASSGIEPTESVPAPSLNADGSCNTSDPNNWGDPLDPDAPCGSYYPIIHIPGDYQLSQGVGQGVLLVDGDLKITGQFTFYGPVIVKGTLDDEGRATIVGGLMAAGLTGTSTIVGNAVVQYSTCALINAIHGSAKPSMAALRPWVELP